MPQGQTEKNLRVWIEDRPKCENTEDVYSSHFLLILGHEYLKQRKLRAGKGNICGLSECKKFAFGSILH